MGNDDDQPMNNDFSDFVMVDADEDGSVDGSDDDDSYDYCEDACSILSGDNNRNGQYDLTGSLVLTVPDVLMKDLDDAHAAARLVQFHDTAEDIGNKPPAATFRSSDHYSSASSVVSMEDEESSPSPTEHQVVESTSTNIVEPKVSVSSPADDKPKQAKPTIHTFSIGVSTTKEDTTKTKTKGVGGSMSRTSNKKRRKKLKMLKKAQAAANAAQQLAEKAREAEKTASPPKQQQRVTAHQKSKLRSSSSKKVTNIAVACATETMAAYREELLLRGIK